MPKPTAESVVAEHGGSLDGRRVLITGACTGIGYELARCIVLSCNPSVVYIHGRSRQRVEDAISTLPPPKTGSLVSAAVADLGSLRSVTTLAETLRAQGVPDVIVCCAGVATLPSRTTTTDGFEAQFGINHLAHFHLVTALLPDLPPLSRVVVVSSDVHKVKPTINIDDLNSEVKYSWFGAYIASKLANVLFAQELSARVAPDKRVMVVACSPGTTATDIDRYLSSTMRFLFKYLGPGLFAQSVGAGAATIAFCIAADAIDLETGAFYAQCEKKLLQLDDNSSDLAKQLWQRSTELVQAALAEAHSTNQA